MSLYTLMVKFKSSSENAKTLESSLLKMALESRKEVGCLNYDLHQSTEDPNEFLIYENWQTQAAHAAHDRSGHVLAWRKRKHEFLEREPVVTVWNHLE